MIQINIEIGKHGLVYATSNQIKGLFVAAESLKECLELIPIYYNNLKLASEKN